MEGWETRTSVTDEGGGAGGAEGPEPPPQAVTSDMSATTAARCRQSRAHGFT